MKINIKKFTAGIIMLAITVFTLSYAAFASYDISVLFNGEKIECSQKPVIKDGRTFLPLRDVLEAVGTDVSWNGEKRFASFTHNGEVIEVYPDSAIMVKNGEEKIFGTKPIIQNDRILLPLREISEALSYSVLWRAEDYTVSITDGQLLRVHFLDCNQADSIFIELPDGKCMLVDAGEKAFGKKLYEFIKGRGYSHLDYVVATHPHSDHIGGMSYILENFTVGTFYMPQKEHTTKTFENMLNALSKNGCRCEYIQRGSVIENILCQINVLSPQKEENYVKMNDYSTVIKMKYREVSFLLSADAEADSEISMLNSGDDLKADILKVGHHGSSTSTSESYLNAVMPSKAIISVGKDNKYSFPSSYVLMLLEKIDSDVYRTDISGNVTAVTDGCVYIIETEK